MAMSDLMVSKAGGVTTSEALAAELPMLVIHPIPGQEDENTSFIQRIGAGRVATSLKDLRQQICTLLDHPEILDQMRQRARHVKRPQASADAAAAILALTQRQPQVAESAGSCPI
jgi:processive 1,2-diacylglycerol beta-glucosyltransferase